MIAVTDTSPLNYLIRLGVPGILSEIYGRVLIPAAVLGELKHPGAPEDVRNWASRPPAWLQEVHVRDVDSTLSPTLGLGEREAISLAAEIRADILILDDFKARIAARDRGLQVAGTIAVLREASMRARLPFSFSEAVEQICQLGFRITPKTVKDALAEYEALRKDRESAGDAP